MSGGAPLVDGRPPVEQGRWALTRTRIGLGAFFTWLTASAAAPLTIWAELEGLPRLVDAMSPAGGDGMLAWPVAYYWFGLPFGVPISLVVLIPTALLAELLGRALRPVRALAVHLLVVAALGAAAGAAVGSLTALFFSQVPGAMPVFPATFAPLTAAAAVVTWWAVWGVGRRRGRDGG